MDGPARFVVRCDAGGGVEQVIRDDVGAVQELQPGTHLSAAFAAGSREKAEAFLDEIREERGASQWQLLVERDSKHQEVYLAGGPAEDGGFLIIGARSQEGAAELYSELMEISNEQANLLRVATRDRAAADRTASRNRDAEAMVERMTEVNNELTNLQRELARKNAELERLHDEKNRFLGMAAHDLRNPLGIIQAYAEFLLHDDALELEGKQTRFLESIHDSSRFMLQLVNDLLDVSKIEAGAIDLSPETTDLAELVERIARLNRLLASEKEIEVELQAPDSLDAVVDPGKIEQVLTNLLTNAVKYSEEGTTVRVELREGEDGVVLAVADEGQGIPPDELAELFEPFASTSVETTAGESSTGLGLAITQRIVQAHGGEIEVESEVGEGSTFTVRLPVRPPET
jgi:signal transduction histidine kinase